jgi:hypothetical protein
MFEICIFEKSLIVPRTFTAWVQKTKLWKLIPWNYQTISSDTEVSRFLLNRELYKWLYTQCSKKVLRLKCNKNNKRKGNTLLIIPLRIVPVGPSALITASINSGSFWVFCRDGVQMCHHVLLNANDDLKSAILNLQFPFTLGKQNAFCSQFQQQLFIRSLCRHPVERVLPYHKFWGTKYNIPLTQVFSAFGPCSFLIHIYFTCRYTECHLAVV